MESLWAQLSLTFNHLLALPSELLSVKGIAQGAGLATLAYARQMVQPMIKTTVRALPAGAIAEAVVDGMWTQANVKLATSP